MGIGGGAAKLQIIIDAQNKASDELKELQNELKKTGKEAPKAGKGVGSFGASLKSLATTAGIVTGGLVAVGVAAKKIFDITEEGARINDLAASFDNLGLSLSALDDAAGGTIAHTDLMAAANKALAGTQDELRDAMAGALPNLLEMSRAAVKLDPTLGSVDHAFMSLIAGIKKGQPLLIDNTNAIVSVGAANERWAKANGVAVESMSAAQKQLALLNETQRAGKTMIDQVGGSVEREADAWAQLTSEIKNHTDALKAQASEAVQPAIEGMAQRIKLQREFLASGGEMTGNYVADAIALKEFSEAQDKANEGMERQAELGGATAMTLMEAATAYNAAGYAMTDTALAVDQYNQALGNSAAAAADAIQAQLDLSAAATNTYTAMTDAAMALQDYTLAQAQVSQIQAVTEAMREQGATAQEVAEKERELLLEFGLLTSKAVSTQGAMEGLAAAHAEGRISVEAYSLAVATFKKNLDAIDGTVVTIDFDFNVPQIPSAVGQVTDYREAEAFQAVGGVSRGGRTMVGERGPELVDMPTGATVHNNQVTNNYNTTVNTRATSGTYAQDIAWARM